MVDRDLHPHTISVTVITGTTTPVQDDKGDWISQNTTKTTITSECRAIPNGNQKKIRGINGDLIDFEFMVSLPKDIMALALGLEVVITNKDQEIFKGVVKRFFRGTEIARLWV